MATTLRDFISQREAEIRELQKALKAELKDLQIARAALEAGSPPQPQDPSRYGGATHTIKDMARYVLEDAPNGYTSSEILQAIHREFGREIDRTSLSPQLSRLKEAQELVLENDRWFTKTNHEKWRLEQLLGVDASNQPTANHFDDDLEDDVPF